MVKVKKQINFPRGKIFVIKKTGKKVKIFGIGTKSCATVKI